MASRPVVFGRPGHFEIVFHHSPPTDYAEESHDTVQVCVPFENAAYAVERQSETGSARRQRLGPKDILAIPAGQPHQVSWLRAADIASFQLSQEFLAHAL